MNLFKPGGWVKLKYKSYTKPYKILEIVNGLIRLNTELTPSSDNLWREDECMPWHPKVGEWCWFWDENYTTAILAKFENISNGLFVEHHGNIFEYCEPFIGQLPTHLLRINHE